MQPASWGDLVRVILNGVKAEQVPSGILKRSGKKVWKSSHTVSPLPARGGGLCKHKHLGAMTEEE